MIHSVTLKQKKKAVTNWIMHHCDVALPLPKKQMITYINKHRVDEIDDFIDVYDLGDYVTDGVRYGVF